MLGPHAAAACVEVEQEDVVAELIRLVLEDLGPTGDAGRNTGQRHCLIVQQRQKYGAKALA